MRKTSVQSVLSFLAAGLFIVPLVCCCLGTNTHGDSMKTAALAVVMPKAHEASCHRSADAASHHNPSRSELCSPPHPSLACQPGQAGCGGECLKFVGVSSDSYLISGEPKFQDFLPNFSKKAIPYPLSDLLVSPKTLRDTSSSPSPAIQLSSIPLYLKNSILQV